MGDTSGPIIGSNLSAILEKARKYKKEMGDDFVSVEHLLLSFHSDNRFGQLLFKNLRLSAKTLKDAIQAVRGSQRVTDQSMDLICSVFLEFGNMTCLHHRRLVVGNMRCLLIMRIYLFFSVYAKTTCFS